VILQRGADYQVERRPGGVEELVAGAAEQTPIYDRRLDQVVEFGGGVNLAPPEAAAKRIEILRVFADQERFRLAVTALLS